MRTQAELDAALAAVNRKPHPTCSALTGVVTPGEFGFIRHTCHQQRGLRSFIDGRGETRWYCVAVGHEQSVVHRFGRAVATDDDYQPESADGITSFKVEREKEWVQHHAGYDLVIDGGTE